MKPDWEKLDETLKFGDRLEILQKSVPVSNTQLHRGVASTRRAVLGKVNGFPEIEVEGDGHTCVYISTDLEATGLSSPYYNVLFQGQVCHITASRARKLQEGSVNGL